MIISFCFFINFGVMKQVFCFLDHLRFFLEARLLLLIMLNFLLYGLLIRIDQFIFLCENS
jgi:hypothetical protein